MKSLSQIWFPLAFTALVAAGSLAGGAGDAAPGTTGITMPVQDTVVYPTAGYKLRRVGGFEEIQIADSLLAGTDFAFFEEEDDADTLHLSARDTLFPPDSLRELDPWRYKYYVALLDSAVHYETLDSLRASFDTLRAHGEFELAALDSIDIVRLDSTYLADLAARREAEFQAWYASLTPDERKAYDRKVREAEKRAALLARQRAKEEKKAQRDSIIENTPRILETFALPDTMQYKRIVRWQLDQYFHRMNVEVEDTGYNYRFYDFPFQRQDVNSSWLGTAGSPVQFYNFFKRVSTEDVEFYKAFESWSSNPSTIWHYNSKTPHTELAYWGTLLASNDKASDNIHLFTTQNILPELNFSILYDRFGSEGMLVNERSSNKTFAPSVNYIGRKYSMEAGYIYNKVVRGENWGIKDNMWVRDTLVDPRDIPVVNTSAKSEMSKNTVFLNQQLRIPFTFIENLRSRSDSSYVAADTLGLNRDITTAYIGHSSEYTVYRKTYTDAGTDSLGVTKLDNRVFLKLQPWADNALVSRINIGAGDLMRSYFDSSSVRPAVHRENDIYAFAGVEGRYYRYFDWNADTRYVFAGAGAGDFSLRADARLRLYPFRKARTSPLSVGVKVETSLAEPNYYQKVLNLKGYAWENEFDKIKTDKIEASLDIPHWKLDATVGYARLNGNIYYDTEGVARQNMSPMTVLSASLCKDFTLLGFLHLDNKALLQFSSDEEVLPLPRLALNLRYYIQFPVKKDILTMQVGVNGFYNTPWYSPAWNPVLGVFHNQTEIKYTNGPILDAFINMQWKKACIFIKYENAGLGWPLDHADYFSAHHYTVTRRSFKFGIFWPFFIEPAGPGHQHGGTGGRGGGGRGARR